MSAATQNVAIEQGATYQLLLTWKDSTGAVIDMTGYRVHSQFRQHVGGAAVIDADTANPVTGVTIVTPGSTGVVSITVDPSITSTLSGMGVYDLVAIAPSGQTDRLLQGTWAVSDAVTRD